MILLVAVAAVAVATVVVIQLLPNAADGPAVVGATSPVLLHAASGMNGRVDVVTGAGATP